MRIIVTLILALFLLGATDTDTANLTTTDPVAANTGLPFVDDFETANLSTNWPNSSTPYQRTTTQALSGTTSVTAEPPVNVSDSSGQLNRAWGDALESCTTGCFSCTSENCPGGDTDDLWVKFNVYIDLPSTQLDWVGNGEERKLIQLCAFDEFGENWGINLSHCVYYITLLVSDFNGDGVVDDIAMNGFRPDSGTADGVNEVRPFVVQGGNSPALTPGSWNEIVFHAVRGDPSASNGTWQMWVNGILIDDFVGVVDWIGDYAGGQTWNMMLITDNGDGPSSGSYQAFYDDVEIDTSEIARTTTVAATSNWPDVEQRCEDLGTDCHCSEPLDSTTTVTLTGTAEQGFFGFNVPESVSKECKDGASDVVGGSGGVAGSPAFISVAEMTGAPYNFPAFPTGATVERIIVDDVPGQFNVKDTPFSGTTAPAALADQTYCRRHYFVLHETTAMDFNQEDRIKMARNTGGNPEIHHESEFQFGSGTLRTYETTPNDWEDGSGNAWGENNSYGISLADARDKWWRMEHCWDHLASGQLQHRARVVEIATRAVTRLPDNISPGSNATFSMGTNNWIIDGFRQTRASPAVLAPGMWSGFSAAMTALLPTTDETFWIGPACEIEGCP